MTRAEALRQARPLFRAASSGDLVSAEVLVDLIEQAGGTRELAENLFLALRGRATRRITDARGYVLFERGDALPLALDVRRTHLENALYDIRARLFSHRSPCMPSRRDFLRLIESNVEVGTAAIIARPIWRAMKKACANEFEASAEDALQLTDDLLHGHGVERVALRTQRGPHVLTFDYVNFGDTYVATLLYDYNAHRFRVTSWGDLVETWERRWGQADEP